MTGLTADDLLLGAPEDFIGLVLPDVVDHVAHPPGPLRRLPVSQALTFILDRRALVRRGDVAGNIAGMQGMAWFGDVHHHRITVLILRDIGFHRTERRSIRQLGGAEERVVVQRRGCLVQSALRCRRMISHGWSWGRIVDNALHQLRAGRAPQHGRNAVRMVLQLVGSDIGKSLGRRHRTKDPSPPRRLRCNGARRAEAGAQRRCLQRAIVRSIARPAGEATHGTVLMLKPGTSSGRLTRKPGKPPSDGKLNMMSNLSRRVSTGIRHNIAQVRQRQSIARPGFLTRPPRP